MNVPNTAGGSIPTNSEEIFSFLFYTNDGVYAVTFAEEPTPYGAARIGLDDDNCIISSKNEGNIKIHGKWLNVSARRI
ncbi:MAG: hypothetical protein ACRD8Z_21505 [Nitrososphaeraceae archaeon]